MPELPTGTVTFLFTDIQGSTRLLRQLREAYADVLAGHARIVRGAIEEFGGHEIDTQGDSFFAAFARARDAVGAAVAIQRALAAEPWPQDAVVRVRMGIHTGEPLVGGERYVGMGVNRGARICAAGHGGQVLLSNTTRELVEDDLPEDIGMLDLGEHELKDVERPERIFQIAIDGLPTSFPPLRTVQTSAFEGRDEELARAAEEATQPTVTRRRAALAAAVLIVLAAVAAAVLGLARSSSSTPIGMPNSVVALDASGSAKATAPVGARPVALAASGNTLWVANLDDQSVTRVDLDSGRPERTIGLQAPPTSVAATGSAVWVPNGNDVSWIDPRFDRVVGSGELGDVGFASGPTDVRPALAAFGVIWVVHPDGYVVRIDPRTGRRLGTIGVGNGPSAIAAGEDAVWVTNRPDGTVTRIDAETLVPVTIPTGHAPAGLAVNDAGIWIANSGDDAVVRIDPATKAVVHTTTVGARPTAIAATPDALWVANAGDDTLMRLDERSGDVIQTRALGGTPTALVPVGGNVWVAIAAAPPSTPEEGGVARLAVENDFGSLDPALSTSSQIAYATCANLVTYPDATAPEGSRIVPEVAESVPVPAHGGTTYAFRIRDGFRFSPPSNERITAMTYERTIERVADPRMKSPFAHLLSDVAGYGDFVSGKARHLTGVVARGRTLAIRLSRPDGALLANLASGVACPVPLGTPVDPVGVNDLPSTGPYYMASYTPRQQLVLRRNPGYGGDRPSRLDQILFAIGVAPETAVERIEAGELDYMPEGIRAADAARLEARYGRKTASTKTTGSAQLLTSTANGMRWLHMNTSRPLFSDVRRRRAVNYAIDRRALVAQGKRFAVSNPFSTGRPTDDYLPPTIAGSPDVQMYPLGGPNLRRARLLAGRLHTAAVMYAANVHPWPEEAEIVIRNLAAVGIEVEVKQFPIGEFFQRLTRRGEPFDLAVSGFSFGSTDPAEPLRTFDGSTIAAEGNQNFSYFDDPAFTRKFHAAMTLSGAARYRAFGRLTLDLQRDGVPVAAIATNASKDFFSARLGCQVYQPVFGMDLGTLCLRE